MPTWGDLLNQIKECVQAGDKSPFDSVRRKALRDLSAYTQRNTILYASGHLQKQAAAFPSGLFTIAHEDLEGFMEAVHGLQGGMLDLIVHSPGGQAEAVEAIVQYLRSKFSHIRVIVPHQAMSAATMLACAADEILMARHASLGPVDPQIIVHTPLGIQIMPAQAILDQFDKAKAQCTADPKNLAVWVPMLQQYGPALLVQCENAIRLAQKLVATWLKRYMFSAHPRKATRVARFLADHRRHLTHGRPLNFEVLRELDMRVSLLETDQHLQDKVLTVYHATMHTFAATPATKIVENQNGKAFIKMAQLGVTMPPGAQPPLAPQPPST